MIKAVINFGQHSAVYKILSSKKSNDEKAQELLSYCDLIFVKREINKEIKPEEVAIFMNLAFHLCHKDGVEIVSLASSDQQEIRKHFRCKKNNNFYNFCSLAASFGNVHAMQELGLAYEYGFYDEAVNLKKSFAKYQEAVDKGNNLAKFNLATFYETGKGGVAQNLKKSLQLYQEAFKAGSAEAKTRLAFFYENGLTVDGEILVLQDKEKALQLYQAAFAENELMAFFYLGKFYKFNGKEQEAAELLTKFLHCYKARPECDEAVFNFVKQELGQLIYANILPTDIAQKDAQIYYKTLIDLTNLLEAKFKFALGLLKTKQTSAQAIEMMTELVKEKGSFVAEAEFILSKFYKDNKDEKKSLQFLERAKSKNYPPALFEWGKALNAEAAATGSGKNKLSAEQILAKKREAANYFFQAANANFVEAKQALAAFIEEKIFPVEVVDQAQKKAFLLQCATLEIKEAQFAVAEFLQDNEELAKEFLHKAARQNYLPAILLAVKDELDLESRGKMYKQIAESGNVDGQREYALYLAAQEKFGDALFWFDLAAKQKDKLSEEKIVEYLSKSIVPNFQYENEVLKFYEKYSDIPNAAFAAAVILEKNIKSAKGKSKIEAEKKMMLYLKKAAAVNYSEAIAMLERLNPSIAEKKPAEEKPAASDLEFSESKIEASVASTTKAENLEIAPFNRDKIIALEQEIAALELANDQTKLSAKKQELHEVIIAEFLNLTLDLSSDADFIAQRSVNAKFSIAAILSNKLQQKFDINIAKYVVNLLQEISRSSLYENCKNRTGDIFVFAFREAEKVNRAIAPDAFKFLIILSTYYKSEKANQILKDVFLNKAPIFSEIAANWLYQECVDAGNISAYQNLKTLAENRCVHAATLLAMVPSDKRISFDSVASSAVSSLHASRTASSSSYSSSQAEKYSFVPVEASATDTASCREEMENFLSNAQEIKSVKDLPIFIQSMFDRLRAAQCKFFIKGSAVYQNRTNLKRNPTDFDLDILVEGLYDFDEKKIKSFIQEVLNLSIDDIKIYQQEIITVNVKDKKNKIDVSIYDARRLPPPHLSWTADIERRIFFNDEGAAIVEYPRGLEEYAKSVKGEMVLDLEKDFIINPAARGLIKRLCFLETIGAIEKEKIIDQLKKNPENPADLLVQEFFKIGEITDSRKIIQQVEKFITSHSLEGELRDNFIANLSEMAAADSWAKPQFNLSNTNKIAALKTALTEMQKTKLPDQEGISSVVQGGLATQLNPVQFCILKQ